eukprot:4012951-Pleurochrysis_carterae.AAC.4
MSARRLVALVAHAREDARAGDGRRQRALLRRRPQQGQSTRARERARTRTLSLLSCCSKLCVVTPAHTPAS